MAVGALARDDADSVTDVPGSIERDPPLAELPKPDQVVVTDSSVGLITWSRVIGTRTDLPELISGVDEDGVLVGRDRDTSVTWRSVDGGQSWERNVSDGVRRVIDGVEWVARDDAFDHEPAVLTYDTGTGEQLLELPEFRVGVEAPFELTSSIGGDELGLPFSLARRTLVVVDRHVLPDWDMVTGTDEWSSVSVELDQGSWTSTRDALGTSFFNYSVRQTPQGAELLDEDGTVVLGVNGVPGFVGADPVQLFAGGVSVTELYEFDSGTLRSIDVPWGVGDRIRFAELNGTLMAYRSSSPPANQTLAAWSSADGLTWDRLALPVDAADGYFNRNVDGDVMLIDTSIPSRAWTTVDGRSFESIQPTEGDGRSAGDFGFVTVANYDSPSVLVSPDGAEWERIDVDDLRELDDGTTFDFFEFRAIGDRIFLTGSDGNRRLLLFGTVSSNE
ncbi:MAG: hypothetical protein R8G01_14680 [Ilumatobacteraceae bacterium]|nr:hypothetical protein [Ilumatobacteraceae bacterium]